MYVKLTSTSFFKSPMCEIRETQSNPILAFFRLRNEAQRKRNFGNDTTEASEFVRKTPHALDYATQYSG